jgi:hypothetical protein
MKLPFFASCVGWPHEFADALDKIRGDGDEVSRSDFLAHADAADYKEMFYVGKKLDWHVSYRKYNGVYFFVHSGIEYVFADEDQIAEIQKQTEVSEMRTDFPIPTPDPPAGMKNVIMGRGGPIGFPNSEWRKGVAWANEFLLKFDEADPGDEKAERLIAKHPSWTELKRGLNGIEFSPTQHRGARRLESIAKAKAKNAGRVAAFWNAAAAVARGILHQWSSSDDAMGNYVRERRMEFMSKWDEETEKNEGKVTGRPAFATFSGLLKRVVGGADPKAVVEERGGNV